MAANLEAAGVVSPRGEGCPLRLTNIAPVSSPEPNVVPLPDLTLETRTLASGLEARLTGPEQVVIMSFLFPNVIVPLAEPARVCEIEERPVGDDRIHLVFVSVEGETVLELVGFPPTTSEQPVEVTESPSLLERFGWAPTDYED